jgi:hypothetical protein
MKIWTYGEASDKLAKDLDLEEESFIQSDEFVGFFNDGIDEAEAEIHKLGVEDEYFLRKGNLTFAAGDEDIALPTDIYANKIRALIYDYNGTRYPIKRLRRKNKFMIAHEIQAGEEYKYMITHESATTSYQLLIFPTPVETGTVGKIWYVRNANRIPLISEGSLAATRAAVIDIPEFIKFIFQYVKVQCMEKEGHPMLAKAVGDLETQRQLMIATLTEQVVDDDTEIEPDLSHYEDMS